jgi:hypothetical protein
MLRQMSRLSTTVTRTSTASARCISDTSIKLSSSTDAENLKTASKEGSLVSIACKCFSSTKLTTTRTPLPSRLKNQSPRKKLKQNLIKSSNLSYKDLLETVATLESSMRMASQFP